MFDALESEEYTSLCSVNPATGWKLFKSSPFQPAPYFWAQGI